MSVSDKIKALLSIRGKKNNDLAMFLGISPQSMRNKFSRESFSADELIRIANFLDCNLVFELDDSQKIALDISDVKIPKDSTKDWQTSAFFQ